MHRMRTRGRPAMTWSESSSLILPADPRPYPVYPVYPVSARMGADRRWRFVDRLSASKCVFRARDLLQIRPGIRPQAAEVQLGVILDPA